MGQPIFEPLTNTSASASEKELFYCKGPDANGVGKYTNEGFVVHKGSRCRVDIVTYLQDTSHTRYREQLISEGIMTLEHGAYVFTGDHLFSSPSMSAMTVLGRSANGWTEWRTADGRTLDAVKRQVVESTD